MDLRDIIEFSSDGYRFKLHLYRKTKDWYSFEHRDVVNGISVIGQLVRLQSILITSKAFFYFPVISAEAECIKVCIHNSITETNIQILDVNYFNHCTDIITKDGFKFETIDEENVFGDRESKCLF